VEDLPAVRLEAHLDILGERDGRVAVDGDLVVVVHGNELAELEVPGERARLGRDTLLEASVTEEAVGVVVNDLEIGLVEGRSDVCLGNGESDSVGDTLAERAGGDLDTVRDAELRVAGRDGVELAELLEVVHRQLVPEEVQDNVLEGTSVSVREDKPVPVDPARVLRVGLEESAPQQVGDGCHAHWGSRVTRVGLVHDIDREGSDGVDAELIVLLFLERHGVR